MLTDAVAHAVDPVRRHGPARADSQYSSIPARKDTCIAVPPARLHLPGAAGRESNYRRYAADKEDAAPADPMYVLLTSAAGFVLGASIPNSDRRSTIPPSPRRCSTKQVDVGVEI